MNVIQIKKDELIVIGAITRLLKNEAFLVAFVLVIGGILVAVDPALIASQQAIETIVALALIVLVPGVQISSILGAFANNRGTLIAKFEALLAALAANTAATSTNTVITSNSTQAVLNAAPLASLALSEQPATRQDVRDAIADAITAPVPNRVTDVHYPQPVDSARDTGYVQPKSPVQSTPVVGIGTPDAAPGTQG